jgi:hypothetical protein
MSDGSIKLYKNPNRNEKEDSARYQPQYLQLGLIPEPYKGDKVQNNITFHGNEDPSPSAKSFSPIRQETVAPVQQPKTVGLVNVGNNIEHTWAGVDDEIYDDISNVVLDKDQPMIDNNDFVELSTDDSKPINNFVKKQMEIVYEEKFGKNIEKEAKKFLTEQDLKEALTAELQDKVSSLFKVNEDEYILMIDGVVFDIGPLDKIQEQANLLVFGDHEFCEGNPVPAENLLILKRVKVKIGLFLE